MRLLCAEPVLVPSFLFDHGAMAWECSICRKMFVLSVEEAERHKSLSPPHHLLCEFRMHDCALTFYSRVSHTCQVPE